MRLAALALSAMMALPLTAQEPPRLRPLDFAPLDMIPLSDARQAEVLALVLSTDIAGLQAEMAEGRLASEELTLFYLTRIEALDGRLRSFLQINPAALDEARAADAARRAGTAAGPMHGIPVSLKDNIETAPPLRTTANAAVLLDNQPAADAPLVGQLRAAGAVILGKASLSELAGVVCRGRPEGGCGAVGGQALNPHGDHPTLGSSSGSAIATAALLAQASVGTETSGSLIAPASAMGVVALKPTHGLVPGAGIIPLVPNNDTAGPVARSVADAAALLSVIDMTDTDYAAGLGGVTLDGLILGLPQADLAADPRLGRLLPGLTEALTGLGVTLRPTALTDRSGQMGAFVRLLAGGMRHDMMPYIAAHGAGPATLQALVDWNAAEPDRAPFGMGLLQPLTQASGGVGHADHDEGIAALREAASIALERALADSGAEALVSLSSVHAPIYATAGYPAVTLPMGPDANGAPWGVTLIGRKGQDAELLALAHALEQATRARVTPAMALE